MKVLVVFCIAFISGCTSMKQPPPCNGLQGHPCGEKRAINVVEGDLW
jgi:hypothetical protein